MIDTPGRQTPGELLSRRREASGRSLVELATATKIPLPMLQAIELDEYHKISGELYVKSFLRSYATEVGVEPEDVLQLYAAFTGAAPAPAADEAGAGVWQEEEVEVKRLGVPWLSLGLGVAGLLILVVGGFFLIKALSGGDAPEPLPADPASGDSTVVQSESLPGESLLTAGPLADQLDNSIEDEAERLEEDVPAEPAADLDQGASTAPAAIPSETLNTAVTGRPNATLIDGRTWPVVLRLLVPNQRSISLKKDGQREYASVIWADEPLTGAAPLVSGTARKVAQGWAVYWGAEDHFSIKMADASGVQATINDQYRDLGGLGPGQEIILNDPEVIRSNLPSARP